MYAFADDVNYKMNNPINSQIHKLPDSPEAQAAKKKRGRPPKEKPVGEKTKSTRKPGRPKGSKNKKLFFGSKIK